MAEHTITVRYDPAEQAITALEFDLEEFKNFDFVAAVLGMASESAKRQAWQGSAEAMQELAKQIAAYLQKKD